MYGNFRRVDYKEEESVETFNVSGTLGYNIMLFTPTSLALATYIPPKIHTGRVVRKIVIKMICK